MGRSDYPLRKFCLSVTLIFVINAVPAAELFSTSTRVITSVSSTIVSVQSQGMDSGSGVIISPDGLVLTASTLLSRDSATIKIQLSDGQTYSADVVATDSATESALLHVRLQAGSIIPFLTLANSSLMKVGSPVMTAGNPLDSISADHQVAFSVGSITAISDVRSGDVCSRYFGSALETDAAINAGSEGGALLNETGHMIGMTCLCVDRTRMRGCAVPSNRIKAAYEKYLTDQNYSTDAAVCHCSTPTAATTRNVSVVSYSMPSGTTSIQAGTRLQIVTQSASASPCVCNCIASATCRCDGCVVQIDARLNESDEGAKVLNSLGEQVGSVTKMDLMRHLGAQNAGVSFFTPLEKLPGTSETDAPLIDLIAKCSRAFVFIGNGSGVMISEDGMVLTNFHVAGSKSTWTVRLGGETQTRLCDMIEKDEQRDLCLLKIRDISHAPFIALGNSSTLKAGEQVLALGDPFSLGHKNGDPAASIGIISALHRNQGRYTDAVQTDCAINPGNSGGPLINMAGELVGLNGQIISRYGKNNTGIAFSIPVNQIKAALPVITRATELRKAVAQATAGSTATR